MLFLGVVISNTVIGTVQEIRAHRAIRRLKLASRSPVRVIREGEEREVAPEETVKGDLVRLRAGDRVPADAICVDGIGAMNEALLTGESDDVTKQPGDWLMSGSFVSRGAFTVQLERVGESSYLSQLTRSAKAIKRPKSQLMLELARLIRWLPGAWCRSASRCSGSSTACAATRADRRRDPGGRGHDRHDPRGPDAADQRGADGVGVRAGHARPWCRSCTASRPWPGRTCSAWTRPAP